MPLLEGSPTNPYAQQINWAARNCAPLPSADFRTLDAKVCARYRRRDG